MDYKNLATPPLCVADFCLIPIGTGSASVSNEVAAVQKLMKASGLSYSMHSAGTTVEGPWDAVTHLIGQAHTLVHHSGAVRIQSDIRIGTRTDKKQHFSEKVEKVQSILAADEAPATAGTSKETVEKKGPAEGQVKAAGVSASAPAPTPVPASAAAVGTNKGTWASMFK